MSGLHNIYIILQHKSVTTLKIFIIIIFIFYFKQNTAVMLVKPLSYTDDTNSIPMKVIGTLSSCLLTNTDVSDYATELSFLRCTRNNYFPDSLLFP